MTARSAFHWLGALALWTMPAMAFAFFEDTINHVGGALPNAIGATEFGSIYQTIIQSFAGIVSIVGIVMIIRAGLLLTISDDEGQYEKSKKTIIAISMALIIINLAPRIAEAFLAYQSGGSAIIDEEVRGLLGFFETVAAITAIIFIIVSGIRAVISYGGEDGTAHLKRAILGVGAGILLIAAKFLILNAVVVERTPSGLLSIISKFMQALLGFGAFVATIVLIWAGLLMIVNLGKDEQYTRAKNLVIRVGIGLIVILISLALVRFVIG
ncbi:MAG: hypothetical protein PHX87_01725 [Candidatus Peribacteraceae bacterium]|nr:hypothetical protein [Candidatus Peribacteraceae bacterium]MDD5742127.1 hypothetical protein [Candidatus Peribacteraceae bacterium]